jgi:putative ABC transport system substrate-binding protein
MSLRRRDFITLLGGAAAAWPLAARAHPKFFRLGYLEIGAQTDPTVQNLRRQFLLGLRDLGYIEDRQFSMDVRNAGGQLDRLPALAAELVRVPVDIIAAGGEAPIRAARQATDKIPIVMLIAGDPVGSGLVASLARPGGNITGMSALASDMAGKRLELLKEIIPRASRVAVLWNSSNPSKVAEWKDTQIAAQTIGLTLHSVEARASGDFDGAFASILRERPDAMITFTESLTLAFRQQIGSFALKNRLPMAPAAPICGGAPLHTSTRSCTALSRAICRSNSRLGSNWSSTSRPRRRSASTLRQSCSRAPTK